MKLYYYELLLIKIPNFSSEKLKGVVVNMTVVADAEMTARKMASEQAGEEGSAAWLDGKSTSIRRLPMEARVVERTILKNMAN